jgi:hypothetical protein
MKHDVDIDSGALIFIPSFIKKMVKTKVKLSPYQAVEAYRLVRY